MASSSFIPSPITNDSSSEEITQLNGKIDADGFAHIVKSRINGQVADDVVSPTGSSSSDGSSGLTSLSVLQNGKPSPTLSDDYDAIVIDPSTVVQGSHGGGLQDEATLDTTHRFHPSSEPSSNNGTTKPKPMRPSLASRRQKSIQVKLEKTGTRGRYLLVADDPEIAEILRRSLDKEDQDGKKRMRFSDLVFTRQFTTFDRQNPLSSASPFHGFFTLFWLGIGMMLMKICADNWRTFGSVFGRHEIVLLMWNGNVVELGLSDCVMMGLTAVSWGVQMAIGRGWLRWNTTGWIIQSVSDVDVNVNHIDVVLVRYGYLVQPVALSSSHYRIHYCASN